MDELVVAGEAREEAHRVEHSGGRAICVGGCCAEWIGVLGVDGDCAAAHVEESPDGEEPKGEGGEADAEMEREDDEDECNHHHGVHDELAVPLDESER